MPEAATRGQSAGHATPSLRPSAALLPSLMWTLLPLSRGCDLRFAVNAQQRCLVVDVGCACARSCPIHSHAVEQDFWKASSAFLRHVQTVRVAGCSRKRWTIGVTGSAHGLGAST